MLNKTWRRMNMSKGVVKEMIRVQSIVRKAKAMRRI